MGGGILQLASIGAEDETLIARPQITFFKMVFRRHVQFTMESIPQKIKGRIGFGRKVSCTLANNGDLIHSCILEVEMEAPTVASSTWANWVGHRLIQTVEVEIGGQRIDRHTGEWLHIWNELTCPPGKKDAYEKMVGANPTGTLHLYIPLQFWFCQFVGAALPIVALHHHEVKINIQFSPLSSCITNSSTNAPIDTSATQSFRAKMFVDYIFLGKNEKRKLCQTTQEYVINQLQFSGTEIITPQVDQEIQLMMSHPMKEIIWICKRRQAYQVLDRRPGLWDTIIEEWLPPLTDYVPHAYLTYPTIVQTKASGEEVASPIFEKQVTMIKPMEFEDFEICSHANIQFNGTDRLSLRDGRYFTQIQPYQHHTNVPGVPIHVYSFSVDPEEVQPTGACNMSVIDDTTLSINTTGEELRVFGVNYNILRISKGMAGLAFER